MVRKLLVVKKHRWFCYVAIRTRTGQGNKATNSRMCVMCVYCINPWKMIKITFWLLPAPPLPFSFHYNLNLLPKHITTKVTICFWLWHNFERKVNKHLTPFKASNGTKLDKIWARTFRLDLAKARAWTSFFKLKRVAKLTFQKPVRLWFY